MYEVDTLSLMHKFESLLEALDPSSKLQLNDP